VDLRALQRRWDAFARRDPLGAILDPMATSTGGDLDEFFASGEREIDAALADGERHGLPAAFDSALDFGCGAGRLTQAMARRFERCEGVDISPAMVRLAVELNRRGERCRFRVNESDSLAAFEDASFDFAYSSLVLQHLDPPLARGYVAELVRVLRPDGLLVFQLPSERDTRSELPWSAFRARIEAPAGPLEAEPGASVTVPVRVRNDGDFAWPAGLERRPVAVGNHWLGAAGALVRRDDGRALLPRDVRPGEAVELALEVTAPDRSGDYVLELDLVQEGVAWFAERGSKPARVPVTVQAGAAALAPAGPGPPASEARQARARVLRGRVARGLGRRLQRPVEMNAVPRGEVLELLGQSGARVVEVVEDDAAGSGWISLRYTATKDQAG
jgi:SAM-dependent methyltransferase